MSQIPSSLLPTLPSAPKAWPLKSGRGLWEGGASQPHGGVWGMPVRGGSHHPQPPGLAYLLPWVQDPRDGPGSAVPVLLLSAGGQVFTSSHILHLAPARPREDNQAAPLLRSLRGTKAWALGAPSRLRCCVSRAALDVLFSWTQVCLSPCPSHVCSGVPSPRKRRPCGGHVPPACGPAACALRPRPPSHRAWPRAGLGDVWGLEAPRGFGESLLVPFSLARSCPLSLWRAPTEVGCF